MLQSNAYFSLVKIGKRNFENCLKRIHTNGFDRYSLEVQTDYLTDTTSPCRVRQYKQNYNLKCFPWLFIAFAKNKNYVISLRCMQSEDLFVNKVIEAEQTYPRIIFKQ